MTVLAVTGDSRQRWFVGLLLVFIAAVTALGVLWVQSLPKLTLVDGELSIVNCESPLPTYAMGVCPKLRCKKKILESGLFPPHSQIGFDNPKPSAEQSITGAVRYPGDAGAGLVTRPFECRLEGHEVASLTYF